MCIRDRTHVDFVDETGDAFEEYIVFHHKVVEWMTAVSYTHLIQILLKAILFLNFRNNLLVLYKNLPEKELEHVLFIRGILDRVCLLYTSKYTILGGYNLSFTDKKYKKED